MFWDSKYEEFRERVRAFALEKVAPKAQSIDEEQRFPRELIPALAKEGFLAMTASPAYGGSGADTMEYAICVEELSRVCGSTGITVAAHNSLGMGPIENFGTVEQKKKYLPRACAGELVAFGLSEPSAGSDAGGTRTRAYLNGDMWTINGSKCWITSATECFAAVVTAKTSDEPGGRGISSFIIEKGMPGFSSGKKENKLGLRGSDTAFLHLQDVKVPLSQQLGETGMGFKQFMKTLDAGRISIGAMALGLAQGALDCALKFAVEHEQFGKPISDYQGVAFQLADMETEIKAARYMVYTSALMKDRGQKYGPESAKAKLFASEVGTRCAFKAIGILGGAGVRTGEYPAERIWRDVKLCEIGEGTSEIQRLVIARDLIKSITPLSAVVEKSGADTSLSKKNAIIGAH